jgi:hypothetical protein
MSEAVSLTASRTVAEDGGKRQAVRMRAMTLSAVMAGLLLAGCAATSEPPYRPPPGTEIFQDSFDREVFWDYPRAADWALGVPVLVVAVSGTVYPQAPDVDLAIWCRAPGRIEVQGDGPLRIATDVGMSVQPEAVGLSDGVVTVSGTPTWRSTGYDIRPEVTLTPTPDELRRLLSGDALIVTMPVGAEDFGERFPAPPKRLAEAFLHDCMAG